MKNRLVIGLVMGLAWGAVSLMGAAYSVDTTHSAVGFKVKHMMVSTVSGKFNGFNGSYELEKGVLKSLSGNVKATTIDTGIAKRDDHLRSEDFFDVTKYPEITFTMLSHKGKQVNGNLSLHGVTKKITLNVDMGGEMTDNNGNKRSGFVLEGKINRKDFGLGWNKAIETGGVVVGEEVKLIVEIEGIAD